ncbi:MAG: hypothetical protein IJ605_02920 [Prevotella sp.]|nr:hypothetical protein [Prevotella sp.]
MTEYTIISLIALLTLGAIAYIFGRNRRPDGTEEPIVVGEGDCATCTPDSKKCEQICTMEAAVKPIEYFDDEELDAFKGRAADSYTDEEVEQFAYILHTMRPDDVAAWNRSLTLRGISVPDELRDEIILMID